MKSPAVGPSIPGDAGQALAGREEEREGILSVAWLCCRILRRSEDRSSGASSAPWALGLAEKWRVGGRGPPSAHQRGRNLCCTSSSAVVEAGLLLLLLGRGGEAVGCCCCLLSLFIATTNSVHGGGGLRCFVAVFQRRRSMYGDELEEARWGGARPCLFVVSFCRTASFVLPPAALLARVLRFFSLFIHALRPKRTRDAAIDRIPTFVIVRRKTEQHAGEERQ